MKFNISDKIFVVKEKEKSMKKDVQELIHAIYTYGRLVGEDKLKEVHSMDELLSKVEPVIRQWKKKETFEQYVEEQLIGVLEPKATHLQFENEVRIPDGKEPVLWIHLSVPGEEEVHMGYFDLEDVLEGNIAVGNFPELMDNLSFCQMYFNEQLGPFTDLTLLEGETYRVKIDRKTL